MEYYQLPVKEVLDLTESDPDGLSLKKVKIKKEFGKAEAVVRARSISMYRLFLNQFRGYQVWLLIGIAALALTLGITTHKEEQFVDAMIIAAIIVINTAIGIYQDFKAEKGTQMLSGKLKYDAVVLRGGKRFKIPFEEVLIGDIVYLQEGFRVPADGRIVAAKELYMDESMLTGESRPVLKHASPIKEEVPLAERKNMVYMGTFVSQGSGKFVVTETGIGTVIGVLSKALDHNKGNPFVEEVDATAKKISRFALAVIGLFFISSFFTPHDITSVIMLCFALFISTIPEGLPAAVSFALAMGTSKLTKKNVLVKNRSLLETLGSIDTLCTDKTGTLTSHKNIVHKIFIDRTVSDGSKASGPTLEHFRNCALLTNRAKHTERGFVGDPDDIALIDFFNRLGVDLMDVYEKMPAYGFESSPRGIKFKKSYHRIGNKKVRYSKGAVEYIVERCSSMLINGKEKPFTKKERKKVYQTAESFSKEALRVSALSFRKGNKGKEIFIGLVGFYNKPKEGVADVVKSIYEANIELKMITGDDINTATAMAKEIGFRNIKAISWDRLHTLSSDEFRREVEECNIFARMTSDSKLRVVSTLQETGRRVAITGDGVNDVPAIKQADVGIAMGKDGMDIAKEASDLVILDDRLESVIDGLIQGRTIYANVRKVLAYLLISNLAQGFLIIICSVFFGGIMPYAAIHLLWVNLAANLLPPMALGIDPPVKSIIKMSPKRFREKLVNDRFISMTFFIGLKKMLLMFALFVVSLTTTGDLKTAQTISFTWLMLAHFVYITAIRFDERTEVFINRALNWSVAIPILFQLVILYTPLRAPFHVVELSPFQWILLMIGLVISLMMTKIITFMINRHYDIRDQETAI